MADEALLIAIGSDKQIYGINRRSLDVEWRMGSDREEAPESWHSYDTPIGKPVVKDDQVFIGFNVPDDHASASDERGMIRSLAVENGNMNWERKLGSIDYYSSFPTQMVVTQFGLLVRYSQTYNPDKLTLLSYDDGQTLFDGTINNEMAVSDTCIFTQGDVCAYRFSATGIDQKWCYSEANHPPVIALGSLFISGDGFFASLK